MPFLHPTFILFAGALILCLSRDKFHKPLLITISGLALLSVIYLPQGESLRVNALGFELTLLRVDRLSQLFGLVFSLIVLFGLIFSLHVKRWSEHTATLGYAAGALGVVFAGDWITMFVFWELMSVASFLLIWLEGSPRSRAAGLRYLLVHTFGGGLLLAGILIRLAGGATVEFSSIVPLTTGIDWSYWLILSGVGINAAIPPLHAWLTDAYPEASVTGSVFLSVFTTKTAIYVLLRAFPGAEILVPLGVTMALYGVVFAVLENDLRRLLAYHIVSQVGYMVTGVGMGTDLALNGSAAHAFCHILYKALLFMGAGSVIYLTGKRKLTELGGIGKTMPWVFLLYMVGAVSISGFPLFNGFVSKSMVVSAATYSHRPFVELLLLMASIGTFLHTGLKLPFFTFLSSTKPRAKVERSLPKNMKVAMILTALACFFTGVQPGWLYAMLPWPVDYHPYTSGHIVSALQLLLGTAIGFWVLIKSLGGEKTITLDADWIYRKPLGWIGHQSVNWVRVAGQLIHRAAEHTIHRAMPILQNPFRLFGVPKGVLYDENEFRLSIALNIFWAILGFVFVGLYLLFLR